MNSSSEGFVDLRLNTHTGPSEESFWPSFTDIMSVIVMIFLLAMVILLLKNMELVQQLRTTMAAERQFAQQARASAQEKKLLAQRLTTTEQELAQLRQQQKQLQQFRGTKRIKSNLQSPGFRRGSACRISGDESGADEHERPRRGDASRNGKIYR